MELRQTYQTIFQTTHNLQVVKSVTEFLILKSATPLFHPDESAFGS